MTRFSDLTVGQFLEALADPNPTPGGGTASAIAGAIGTALLVMVTGLAKSGNNMDEEKATLASAKAALTPLGATLTTLADADAAAFDEVMSAYRQPKASEEEKADRSAAIQAALQSATLVPLRTLRACAQVMAHAGLVAAHGNRSAVSDVRVAIGLLEAAAGGAEANVRINLAAVRGQRFTTATGDETDRLMLDVAGLAAAARAQLR